MSKSNRDHIEDQKIIDYNGICEIKVWYKRLPMSNNSRRYFTSEAVVHNETNNQKQTWRKR